MLGKLVVGCGALAVSAFLLSAPASAAGCGGYVNLAVWGCAPWDNNPPKKGVTPGYGTPPKPAPQPARPIAQPAKPAVQPNSGNGLINPANTSSSLISNRAGGVINPANTSSSIINPANTSSSVISRDGAGMRR